MANLPSIKVTYPAMAPPAPAQSRCNGQCCLSRRRSRGDELRSTLGGPCAVRLLGNGPLGSAQTGIEHMTLISTAQRQKLLENGRAQRAAIDRQDQALDFEPVVKLFTPDGNATWLLTELNPDIDVAFGLYDLGLGQPELGYEPPRTRRRPRPAGASPRARSSLRADTHDCGLRRTRSRASAHHHLMRWTFSRRPSGRRLFRLPPLFRVTHKTGAPPA